MTMHQLNMLCIVKLKWFAPSTSVEFFENSFLNNRWYQWPANVIYFSLSYLSSVSLTDRGTNPNGGEKAENNKNNQL